MKVSRTGRWSILAVSLVAVVAVVVTIAFRQRPVGRVTSDAQAVFDGLKGLSAENWSAEDLPLSNNEIGQAIVEKTLRYDKVIFRRFSKDNREFSVYLVYWQPGKVDLRAVNAHTPDTCWVQSGWRKQMAQGNYRGVEEVGMTKPGEYRCFSRDGHQQYVAFWHLVGGEVVPMWRNGFPRPGFMWRLLTTERQLLSSEQYFVRISSGRPLDELADEPLFKAVMDTLALAGLSATEVSRG